MAAALLLASGVPAVARGPGEASVTPRESGRARVGEPAPWLAGWTLDDQAVNLEHLKREALSRGGRFLLVVFFATWCEPCRHGLRVLAGHRAALRDAGVHLVLVDYQEEAPRIRPFLATMGLEDARVVLDRFGKVARAYGAERRAGDDRWEASLPTTVLMDARGEVRLIVTREGPDYLDRILGAARP